MGENSSFGKWVKDRRKKWGITQEDLGYKAGVSVDTIRKIESGERTPSKEVAAGIARALGVPEDEVENVVNFARARNGYVLDHEIGNVHAHVRMPTAPAHAQTRPASRLPPFGTPFVGRKKVVEKVRQLLLDDDVRLVTLTGPAGIGKTRLATQVSASLMDEFEEWVFFVGLSPLTSHTMVVPAIAKALDVKEVSGQPLLDAVVGYLRDKRVLLFLDNFEQVVEAGPDIGTMLLECRDLKVLVTSRATLRIYGERGFPVLPMSLPEAGAKELPDLQTLAQYEAVNLFTQRTRDVLGDFDLTDENAAAVVEICRRLDALPLAIELAAARTKVRTPQELLPELDHSLRVLSSATPGREVRQRTLRGAIQWSYNLLDEQEKSLYTQLSVFVGTVDLEAVEAVWEEGRESEKWDVLDVVQELLEKSLLRVDQRSGKSKYGMLWTIREFAQERLEERGEAQATRRRHAEYYLKLAEEAEPHLTSAGRAPWLEQLEAEHHNLRAALDWCLSEDGDKEIGLRLAGALGWFWFFRSYLTEGREWLEKALTAASPLTSSVAAAKALNAAGRLAIQHFDFSTARSKLDESVATWRDVGNKRGLAYSLSDLGIAVITQSELLLGNTLIEEGVALFREVEEKWGLAFSLDRLADAKTWLDNREQAAMLYSESLSLFRELGDKWGIAMELRELGDWAMRRRDYVAAAPDPNKLAIPGIDQLDEKALNIIGRRFEPVDDPWNYVEFSSEELDRTHPVVWKPCAESFSPFSPFYHFIKNRDGEKGDNYYVRIDGQAFKELHDDRSGG